MAEEAEEEAAVEAVAGTFADNKINTCFRVDPHYRKL